MGSGFVGHLYSAVPDLLFTLGGVLHARWMDVFDLHITAHFLWPSPALAWGCSVDGQGPPGSVLAGFRYRER